LSLQFRPKGNAEIAGLDIAGLDNGGPDSDGLDIDGRMLPPREIADALFDIQAQLDADSQHASRLQKLIAYVNRQWITKRSIGVVKDCFS